MKNRRNIVELKYPPENPNDIWLKDGKFYRSTSEGWIVIDSKTEYISKESMTADNPKGGTMGIDKETGETSIYNDVAKQWSPLNGGGVTSITWQELKDKRDAGKLIPGALYRITDYQCTTTQENTQSAGHQFDIVLLALSENKLAEEGWAMMHDNIYDVTFSDGVTKKCYIYCTSVEDDFWNVVEVDTMLGWDEVQEIEINEDTKTAIVGVKYGEGGYAENLPYNYFQNSNLSAWKVWYCLDNDKSRFAWADDSVDESSPAKIHTVGGRNFTFPTSTFIRNEQYDEIVTIGQVRSSYYAWVKDDDDSTIVYTTSNPPLVGVNGYLYIKDSRGFEEANGNRVEGYTPGHEGTNLPKGRGVIYRLIDEWNNDVGYDFKNIQFIRPMTDGEYDSEGKNTWCYTFALNFNGTIVDSTIPDYNGNTFANYTKIEILHANLLPNHVFIGSTNSCYIDVNSFSCTILYGKSVILHNCGELVHVDGNEQSAIYINNKKVLTES